MNRYYLRGNRTGRYFVKGSGFTATTRAGASQLTSAEVAAARSLGFEPSTTETVRKSWAVNYIRPEDIVSGRVQANTNNPSARRFATKEEAVQHGTKFPTRSQSAGHAGFYVTETNDPVNAAINWDTGLTNAI